MPERVDGTVIEAAVILALCHLLAPVLFRWRERLNERILDSFGGGLAVCYVFLFLFAELDAGHQLIGDRIHFLALVGFVIFFGVDQLVFRLDTAEGEGEAGTGAFLLRLGLAMVYNFSLAYALAEQLPEPPYLAEVYIVSMGLHLIVADHGLQERFGRRFATWGRGALVLTILAGFGLSQVSQAPELAVDVVTALLAGFVLFNVMSEELPEKKHAHFPAFLTGVTLFALAHFVLRLGGAE